MYFPPVGVLLASGLLVVVSDDKMVKLLLLRAQSTNGEFIELSRPSSQLGGESTELTDTEFKLSEPTKLRL